MTDEVFAAFIMWMSFATVNKLNGPDFASNLAETFGIMEEEVGALVSAGTPGEAYGQDLGIELHTEGAAYLLTQLVLGFGVGVANTGKRNADCITQIIVVRAPAGNA